MRRGNSKIIKALPFAAVLATAAAMPSAANATLIGDSVRFQRIFQVFPIQDQTTVVGPGVEFNDFGRIFFDLDASSISFSVIAPGLSYSPNPSTSIIFSGLEWQDNPNGRITGISNFSSSGVAGFTENKISFTDDSITIDATGFAWGGGASGGFTIETDHGNGGGGGDPEPEFELDAVNVLAGDPDAVQRRDLGAVHKLSAQSVGAAAPASETSTAQRRFTFSVDGETEPVEVFIFALLDGFLVGDNLGEASVQASLSLTDTGGNALGGDNANIAAESELGQLVEVDVAEFLSFSAFLTPGVDYILESSLTVNARGNGGAGRALFDNSFEYALSGEDVNPFAIPEPSTLIIFGIGLAGLAVGRRRRRLV